MLDLTYIDDYFLDGEPDVEVNADIITSRYGCNGMEWVPTEGSPVGDLEIHLSNDSGCASISTEAYIRLCLESGCTELAGT